MAVICTVHDLPLLCPDDCFGRTGMPDRPARTDYPGAIQWNESDDDPRTSGPRYIAVSLSEVAPILEGQFTVGSFALLIGLPGRHGAGQVDALFTKNPAIFGDARTIVKTGAPDLKHNPFLAVRVEMGGTGAHTVRLEIIRNARALLDLPDDTPVMVQWPGQFRSDWFHFTVRDFRTHVTRAQETPS